MNNTETQSTTRTPMPVEPKIKISKRAQASSRRELEDYKFDGVHAREIELKRNRGEISCAECRRLKIKCDKQIPCQSCQRRGCAGLCPNGSLATGQGTRFVLAATEHLHKRISKMGDRIHQLEDALAAAHGKHSNEPHPLLRDDLLNAKVEEDDGFDAAMEDPSPTGDSESTNPPIQAFGTLSISNHYSRFFGATGGTESLLAADTSSSHNSPSSSSKDSPARDSKSPSLPSEFSHFSQSFPFTPMGPAGAVQDMIFSLLPTWERACSLCETYLEQAAWLFHAVSPVQLMDEMLPTFYKRAVPDDLEDDYSGPHDLAVLFLVFAVGALVDLTQEPSNAEAEHYHQIARAAICLQPVLERPSLVTIQALHLLSIYNAMSGSDLTGSETSMETTWSLITLAAQLSQTIGLHRDSARWGLSHKMVERRRVLFWDLFVADSWTSLNTGRPPSFSLAYIDCRLPGSDDKVEDKEDNPFENFGFRFASECVAEVALRTLTAKAPSYSTIMDLDRKVREFPIPEEALAAAQSDISMVPEKDLTPSSSMQRCVLAHTREVILLYIHRSFFAQAIIDYPTNPLKSPYAPSFLSAYRSSSTILKSIRDQFSIYPGLCSRFWLMWTFAFSSAVVFGTIVSRGPASPLASAAMHELEQACLLFSKAARHSKRAAKALPILTNLSEKARYALASVANDRVPAPGHGSLLLSVNEDELDDELAIFAGRTRIVNSQRPSPVPSRTISQPYEPQMPSYQQPPPQPDTTLSSSSSSSSTYPSDVDTNTMLHEWYSKLEQEEYAREHREHEPPEASRQQQQYRPTPPSSQTYSNREVYGWPHASSSVPHPYPAYVAPQYQTPQGSAGQQYHQLYATTPAFEATQITHQPPAELSTLGLVSRDSKLDARWVSFMHDSGLLDGLEYSGY